MQPEQLDAIRAEVMPKLVRINFVLSIANMVLVIGLVLAMYLAATKRPQVLAVTANGQVIPVVPLDKPYLGDSRIVGFADECTRAAFSHDFLNFRKTLATASNCFTSDGGVSFNRAIDPLIQDLEQKRMVMTPTLQPAVIVKTFKRGGNVHSWVVQTKMTLFREGTKERVAPAVFVVDLVIERVPLEESVRGVGISQVNVRPGTI